MGIHVRAYANMFNEVYAFEPHWLNFYCMSYNCPYENVYKFQAALGAKTGRCKINNMAPTSNMGAYRVDRNNSGDGDLPMLTIDELNLPYVDLIQLDVEGHEGFVIQGGKKTIEKHKPVIIVENARPPFEDAVKGLGYVLQEKSISDQIYYIPS
jgi:FkbM family methyltransferase